MNKESLKNLPILVSLMDENLSINIGDFVNCSLMKDLHLNQSKLIESIKLSHKFHYDTKTSLIKFKEKADRNIFILNNFFTADTEKALRDLKEEEIKSIIKEMGKNYLSKIKKVDTVDNAFHFVFEHEDISMDVEKHFLKLKEQQGIFEGVEIFLAAESLKRRVINNLNPQYDNLSSQVQFLNSIIRNPTTFIQRRFTINECKNSKKGAKFSQDYTNQEGKAFRPLGNTNSSSKAAQRKSTVEEYSNNHLQFANNFYFSSIPLPGSHRNSKVMMNKFDMLIPINTGNTINPMLNLMKERDGKRDSGNSGNSRSFLNEQLEILETKRRISEYNKYNMGYNSVQEMRTLQGNLPKNKDYEISIDNLKEDGSFKLTYNYKEILSVYFHMNFLRKFELPEEFKNNFLPGLMTESVKPILESSKAIKEVIRDRAHTFSNNLIKKRFSSASKTRLSIKSRHNSTFKDAPNSTTEVKTRNRNVSVKF